MNVQLNMKNVILIFSFIVLISFCNNNDISDVERIAGHYESIVFKEPGQLDYGVDVLKNGGSLTAKLYEDFIVEGYVRIPKGIGSNYPPMENLYIGW